MDDRTVVGVLDTRVGENGLEGLVAYSDGSREWRAPSNVSVEIVNDRTGEPVPVSDVKIKGAACA